MHGVTATTSSIHQSLARALGNRQLCNDNTPYMGCGKSSKMPSKVSDCCLRKKKSPQYQQYSPMHRCASTLAHALNRPACHAQTE